MSADLELTLRRWIRRALGGFGTPAFAVASLSMAVAYLAGAALWERLVSVEVGRALPGSLAFWAMAALLLIDSAVGLRAATPIHLTSSGALAVRSVDRRTLGTFLLRAAYAMAALAFLLSTAARDRMTFRLAEGEPYDEAADQLIDRDPQRPFSAGPFAFPYTLDRARPGRTPVAELVRTDGKRVVSSPWRPWWTGWGRFVRPIEKGLVVRYEISRVGGPAMEDAFARLDLLPAGKTDTVRLGAAPHRLALSIPAGTEVRDGFVPPLRVQVTRGKRVVADEVVSPGLALRFEGLALRFLEARSWIAFSMVRDPGIPLAALAAALALAGVGLRMSRRGATSVPGPETRRPEPAAGPG